MKACVAFVCFVAVLLVFQIPMNVNGLGVLFLSLSGIIGLMIGDIFLLSAFTHLGSGRVLMIFGFQPMLLGVASFYLFGQPFEWHRLIAVLFFILCLVCFSLESFKEQKNWQVRGITFALIGVFLDACGILLTKKSFEMNPEMSAFLANAIRSGATALGFFVVSFFIPKIVNLKAPFISLSRKERNVVIFASVLGTFASLAFYLKAIQVGHLATISAIAGTSPLFATLFEISQGRKKMTLFLALALIFFAIGFSILFLV